MARHRATFQGKPCRKCGSTERYAKGLHYCVKCRTEWSRQYRQRTMGWQRQYYEQNLTKQLYNRAATRARNQKLDFTLTLEHVEHLVETTPVCPVLGIPFEVGMAKSIPGSRSLDRRGNEPFYADSNTCLISWRANKLKGDGTLEEFEALVRYMKLANDNDARSTAA